MSFTVNEFFLKRLYLLIRLSSLLDLLKTPFGANGNEHLTYPEHFNRAGLKDFNAENPV